MGCGGCGPRLEIGNLQTFYWVKLSAYRLQLWIAELLYHFCKDLDFDWGGPVIFSPNFNGLEVENLAAVPFRLIRLLGGVWLWLTISAGCFH